MTTQATNHTPFSQEPHYLELNEIKNSPSDQQLEAYQQACGNLDEEDLLKSFEDRKLEAILDQEYQCIPTRRVTQIAQKIFVSSLILGSGSLLTIFPRGNPIIPQEYQGFVFAVFIEIGRAHV